MSARIRPAEMVRSSPVVGAARIRPARVVGSAGQLGHGRDPEAMAAMSARVYSSSRRRISSPTPCQIDSRTHWPSWSQAPSVWGSPKSPRAIGPFRTTT